LQTPVAAQGLLIGQPRPQVVARIREHDLALPPDGAEGGQLGMFQGLRRDGLRFFPVERFFANLVQPNLHTRTSHRANAEGTGIVPRSQPAFPHRSSTSRNDGGPWVAVSSSPSQWARGRSRVSQSF